MTLPPDNARDLRIDFLRGIALLIIFSDHIPGNLLARYTPIALGYSDMAEVFIFLSGYACGISYGRRLIERGFINCLKRAWTRAAQVYGAKIFVTTLALSALVILERWVAARFLGLNWNITLVKSNPFETILELELFRLEIQQFCVLALYVPLMMMLPLVVWCLSKKPWHSLLGSSLLYILTQVFPHAVKLPSPWQEAMYFNPFAWQFLFYGATAMAMFKPEICARFSPNWRVTLLFPILLLSLIFLVDELHRSSMIYSISKHNLGWLRLIHFLCVASVSWWIAPSTTTLSRCKACLPLITLGRFSLVGYCAVGILDIFGEAVLSRFPQSWPMQAIVNILGWIGCIAVTAAWRRYQSRGETGGKQKALRQ